MPTRPTGVTDNAAASGVMETDVFEHPASDLATTTTADPGTSGTTLAVTAGTNVSRGDASGFKIRVIGTSGVAEIMAVTAGGSTNSWTVTRGQDGTTGVAHSVGATVQRLVGAQRVVPISERLILFQGITTSFRTPGRAATAQNIFSIFNVTGSGRLVALRRLSGQVDQTVVRLTVAPSMKVARATTAPTNGTALGKLALDTALSSSASVEVRGDASADGTGSATTLTSTPDAVKGWTQFLMRENTLVGQTLYPDDDLIPRICDTDPIILREGQGILAHISAAATTDNPATAMYVINCLWDEFVYP